LGIVIFLVGLIVGILICLVLLIFVARRSGTWSTEQRSWLDYGNFFIVSIGIAAVTVGFLVILLVIQPFKDKTEALSFLAALFGVVTGLVGTYFGVKQSADSREGAHDLARSFGGAGTTTPTITIKPSSAIANLGANHEVTATVTSVDGSRAANVAVSFAVIQGPDVDETSPEAKLTDELGQASWTFENNGTAGTDTIEAKALEGTGTATVEFRRGQTSRGDRPESRQEPRG
jgi:hypothetical protein